MQVRPHLAQGVQVAAGANRRPLLTKLALDLLNVFDLLLPSSSSSASSNSYSSSSSFHVDMLLSSGTLPLPLTCVHATRTTRTTR
jgi:hypothetical protein